VFHKINFKKKGITVEMKERASLPAGRQASFLNFFNP
jgi:hypothetical protein